MKAGPGLAGHHLPGGSARPLQRWDYTPALESHGAHTHTQAREALTPDLCPLCCFGSQAWQEHGGLTAQDGV